MTIAMLPISLIRELSGADLKVYLVMLARDQGQGCWASWATLAEETGLSRVAVRTAARSLRKRGLITLEQRFDEHGGQESNLCSCLLYVRAGEVVDQRLSAEAK